MAEYTVQDGKTGKEITFEWNGEKEPTQRDMLAVFAEANKMAVSKPQAQESLNMPWYQNAAIGIGKGLSDVNLGVMQKLLQGGKALGVVPQESLNLIEQDIQANRDAFKPLADKSTAANVGEFIGGALPFVPLPGGVTGGALKRMGTSALSGMGAGVLQPTTQDESSMSNAVIGGLFGLGTSGALSGGGKVVNAIKDKNPALYQSIMEKYGKVRQTTGEISQNAKVQLAESLLEKLPFGIEKFRRKQHQEAEDFARNIFAEYVVDPTLPTTAAMKESNKKYVNDLYTKFKNDFADLPSAPAPNTKQVTAELLDNYPEVFTGIQNKKVKKILTSIYKDVSDQEGIAPVFTVDDLWKLRQGIGREIGSSKDNISKGEYDKLYTAISNDLDGLLNQGGGTPAVQAFRDANEAFKTYNLKFDVMREAWDKSIGTTSAKEMFSPKAYSTELKKLVSDPNNNPNIKWSPEEIETMTGAANLLQLVKRSGQYMENPANGMRWEIPKIAIAATGGAGAVLAPKVVGTTAGIALVTKFLTTTEPGKRLALAASKIEPDNPSMKVILKMIYNQVPKFAAIEGTDR